MDKAAENRKTLTLIMTHACNLNCTYCYEKFKSNNIMSFETAKAIIDREFSDVEGYDFVEVNLFGGEPFLRFDLIRSIVEYIEERRFPIPHIVFATTNGTLVHGEVQDWLRAHTHIFQCSLSLDGPALYHDMNRSNSFHKIDLAFFRDVYPDQTIKMTFSAETLPHLYECVVFGHEAGFQISCNLAFQIDWSNARNEALLTRELEKLCNFYLDHPEYKVCSMLDKKIEYIGYSHPEQTFVRKYCGTGTDMPTYDTDGQKYGCQFFSPVTLGKERALAMQNEVMSHQIDIRLLDPKCQNCVIKDLCPTCYGANYASTGSLYKKDPNMCKLTILTYKAIAVFRAMQWERGQLPPEYTGDTEQALLRAILAINDMENK